MIVVRSPLRISFAGGGSDFPAYCHSNYSLVISATINQFVYIFINSRHDNKIRLSYSKTEIVDSVDDLEHDIVRETLRRIGITGGIEIASIADLPSGAGLGSSGAFTTGLIKGLFARLQGKYCSPNDVYRIASEVEIDACKKNIGYQDQAASAIGGLNAFEFHESGFVSMQSLSYSRYVESLEDRLVLIDTGMYGPSSHAIETMRLDSDSSRLAIATMVTKAQDFRDAFLRGYIDDCATILNECWELKKSMSSAISNSVLDDIHSFALKNGAMGGKLCGAGGRGAMLFITEPDKAGALQYNIHAEFGLVAIPVVFCNQGASVVYCNS